ncbi:MAG TPA: COX15/CtaA family protein [Gemmatimonadaceae bacterium]|nr:COX15/CtaA family protein [Gemmatimonadaceae bacterium]
MIGPRSKKILRTWLIATAISVVVTLIVGGATRLTESGLSITEWKPVTGVLPPVGDKSWGEAYEQYQQIPEAQTVHAGITLSQFKVLYWWEWAHRLAGRLVGLVVLLPFLWFWHRGTIPRDLFPRLASLPLLVGAQGALGWYMVSSGLAERTSVSPYRLVAHLSLALLIFAIAVWTAAELGRSDEARAPASPGVRRAVHGLTFGAALTIISGGFVAGLDAGRIFNEFPLMGGEIVPAGYDAGTGIRNWFENPIAAQFNHRWLAILLAVSIWVVWIVAERRWPVHLRRWMRLAATVGLVQAGLGITTLLLGAPVLVAMLHQLGAVALLTSFLIAGVEANASRNS